MSNSVDVGNITIHIGDPYPIWVTLQDQSGTCIKFKGSLELSVIIATLQEALKRTKEAENG